MNDINLIQDRVLRQYEEDSVRYEVAEDTGSLDYQRGRLEALSDVLCILEGASVDSTMIDARL